MAFDLVVETQTGAPLEVQGRKTAVACRSCASSRCRRTSARRRGCKLENQRLAADYENMLGLIDALKMPFWMRGADGRLKWVNRAYAEAVEAADAGSRAARRQGIPRHRGARGHRRASSSDSRSSSRRVSTVIAGDRRVFAVTDFAGADGVGRHRHATCSDDRGDPRGI